MRRPSELNATLADDPYERLPALAAELIERRVAVIVVGPRGWRAPNRVGGRERELLHRNDFRLWPILLQKSFCTGDQKFYGLQAQLSCKDVRDLIASR
jgi:hypothetical protein